MSPMVGRVDRSQTSLVGGAALWLLTASCEARRPQYRSLSPSQPFYLVVFD